MPEKKKNTWKKTGKSRAGQKNEKEMWDRLRELNKGFKGIKEHKKKPINMSKRMLKQIVNNFF